MDHLESAGERPVNSIGAGYTYSWRVASPAFASSSTPPRVVRFGAATDDAQIGRWLAKDPIGFEGAAGPPGMSRREHDPETGITTGTALARGISIGTSAVKAIR